MLKKNIILFLILSITILNATDSIITQITGQVQYEGKAPRPKKLNMAADPICGKAHEGKPVFNESFKINEEQYMENVMVWVIDPKHAQGIPESSIELDQIGCAYVPRVTGIMKGQNLIIKNSDKTLHNIHSMSEVNSSFNFAMPAKSDPSSKNFSETEEPFYIKCDVHPWMKSWMIVLDHPYWSVTDENGNYAIDLNGLETGEYELCFWHEKWDKSMKANGYCGDAYKQTITVTDKDITAGTKIFKRPPKKK